MFSEFFPHRDLNCDIKYFDEFYQTKFDSVKDVVVKDEPLSREVIDYVRNKGLRTALATNPLFPSIATEKRIAWAGLSVDDFEFFTTYENSSYSKPNLDYYRWVVSKMGLSFEECLMVGNDTLDDMAAGQGGMNVFLLTDNLLNREDKDITRYDRGGFDELEDYIKTI